MNKIGYYFFLTVVLLTFLVTLFGVHRMRRCIIGTVTYPGLTLITSFETKLYFHSTIQPSGNFNRLIKNHISTIIL